jgi:small subunit ribosomal protein S8e
MENYHGASGSTTKGTGGKRGCASDKKLRLVGGTFTATKIGQNERKSLLRTRGRTSKVKLKAAHFANVLLKDGKMRKVAMRTVLETPDNRHHARQNILTKGAVVDTEVGKVKITNRVGQDGVVNAVQL